jgi:hypothetical protein
MRSIITRNKQLQDKDNWNDSSLLINNEQLSQAPSTEESLATNQAFGKTYSWQPSSHLRDDCQLCLGHCRADRKWHCLGRPFVTSLGALTSAHTHSWHVCANKSLSSTRDLSHQTDVFNHLRTTEPFQGSHGLQTQQCGGTYSHQKCIAAVPSSR